MLGKTPTKRKYSGPGDQTQQPKRPKKSLADDLICPISLELPLDPVTAEDGRVYDRESIEEHFKTTNQGTLKSPITREKMGSKLLPAIQHRNTIEALIDAHIIEKGLATKWRQRMHQKKQMDKLFKKAEAGDGEAMYNIGYNFERGQDGFKRDPKLAFPWFKRASEAGHVLSTAVIGNCYLQGFAVDKCLYKGIMFVTTGANKGSPWAAYLLGMAFADGQHGVTVDRSVAIHWLRQALKNQTTTMLSAVNIRETIQKLKELKAKQGSFTSP
ncbi:Sel1 domain protein repeat-containing protein [Seminavis robusta]|uniref:Sel1 domain protein repeat-containing protein n=1 Tax=Seminavis robusta TaxID=568900 RepID=A0A9N8DPZ5_9STRA|nr:Sel1 domain protein repeat-containing protein [Seminavis robusta]|eukprot:Sro177_g077640.1 Sel1 domain protein repeat-containing protein (271) ;mRNA; r:19067-19879